MSDMLEWQQQVIGSGNEPHPKLICVTGNNSNLRSYVSEELDKYFLNKYHNSIVMDTTDWLNGIVWGKEMSDWGRETAGISSYQSVDAKSFADLCISLKRRDEFDNIVESSFNGSVDTVLWEGGHYTLILSSTVLPRGKYWDERSYKVLVNSPDRTTDDATIDYTGVEPDIVIDSIETFNREFVNMVDAIEQKESYGVEGKQR